MVNALELIGPRPRLAAECSGTGDTVVFLHGVGGNRSNWRGQLKEFAPEFRCIAFDARGYGDSDDFDGAVTFRDFAADLTRVLDHYESQRAHIVGLSMGGMAAQHFWQQHPARVASLVLCDTTAGMSAGLTPDARAEFLRARKAPLLAGKTPRDIAPAVARALVSPHASPGAVQELIDSMCALRSDGYIKALDLVAGWDGIGELERVNVPTLVVVGEDDRLTPPQMSRELAARIPGAQLVVIGRAGHLPNIERRAEFNAAVLGFLRHSSRGGR